ncbi:MAG: hypothetical protein GX300_02335 [Tissierellia bacterium]|nr:hypothetical protein [Tissierellia bacterium]
MKKSKFFTLAIIIVFIGWLFLYEKPTIKGFYQGEANGYFVQILIRKDEGIFVEWIDNREVDRGTFKKINDKSYSFESDRQSFQIELNKDNSFEIFINNINGINPIIMKKVSSEDTWIEFGEFDDVEEYKGLLD